MVALLERPTVAGSDAEHSHQKRIRANHERTTCWTLKTARDVQKCSHGRCDVWDEGEHLARQTRTRRARLGTAGIRDEVQGVAMGTAFRSPVCQY